MSLTLTKEPKKIITGGSGSSISKWTSAHNPVWFNFHRQDYAIVSITAAPPQTWLTGVNVTGLLHIEDPVDVSGVTYSQYDPGYIYINTPLYKGVFKVYRYYHSGGGTRIWIYNDYTVDDLAGGYLNDLINRKNYKVELQIMKTDLVTPSIETLVDTRTFTPGPDGIVKCNIQTPVKTLVSCKNAQPYNNIFYADTDASCSYKLYYREYWEGAVHEIPGNDLLFDDFNNTSGGWTTGGSAAIDTVNGVYNFFGTGGYIEKNLPFKLGKRYSISTRYSNAFTYTTGSIGTLEFYLDNVLIKSFDLTSTLINEQVVFGFISENLKGGVLKVRLIVTGTITMYLYNIKITELSYVPNEIYYANNSAKQLQETNGSNIAEYVTVSPDIGYKAKLISALARPVYFIGFPFDLGFINSEYMAGMIKALKQDVFTQGLTTLTNLTDNLPIENRPVEGRFRLRNIGGYPSGTKFIDVWLRANEIAQEQYVDNGYVAADYFESIPDTPPGITPYDLTEKLRVELVNQCFDFPVFIRWKASSGGWSYWLFHFNQKEDNVSSEESIYSFFEEDIETSEGSTEVWSKNSHDEITCAAYNIAEINKQGIKTLFDSARVQMLSNPSTWTTAGAKWQTVRIKSKSFKTQTRENSFNLEVVIQLQERNTISQ